MMDRVIPVRMNAHPTEPHNDFYRGAIDGDLD